jgi:hypothetical protein
LGHVDGGSCLLDNRSLQFDLGVEIGNRGFSALQVGSCGAMGDLKIPVIDRRKDLTGIYEIVVVDQNILD